MTTTDERLRSSGSDTSSEASVDSRLGLDFEQFQRLAHRLGYDTCQGLVFADPQAALAAFGGPEGLAAYLASGDEEADEASSTNVR